MHLLEKYANKRFETILSLLEKPAQQWRSDTFHHLRVEIKKLSAFFILIKASSPQFKSAKAIRPFKRLFKLAGKMRELEVEEKLLKPGFEKHLLNTYKGLLSKEKRQRRNDFFRLLETITPAHLKNIQGRVIHLVPKKVNKAIRKNMALQLDNIKLLLHDPHLKINGLHTLRKALKKYSYNLRSISQEDTSTHLTKTEELMHLLGQWHDKVLCIAHFKKVKTSKLLNTKETLQLRELLINFKAESVALRRQIKQMIPFSELYETNFELQSE